jgi:drug/metabolite transporter (DMT)-like permease
MSSTYSTQLAQEQAAGKPVEGTAAEVAAPARNRLGIVLALLAVYLIWGSTYLGIRIALEGFPPFLMGGVRFLIAGGGLYLFLRLRGAPGPTRRQWIGSALVGCLLLVGGNGGVIVAEQWVASGLAAVWVSTMPVWAALFAGLFGRWPGRLEWLGLTLGVAGVALLYMESDFQASPLGAIALTIATVSWAFGSVWSSRLSLPSGLMASAAQMLAGGLVLFLLSLGAGEKMTQMPGERPILALLYLIIFGSIIAFSAYLYLLKHVRPTVATSYAYVNPVVAVGLGVWLAGEQITAVGLAGMAIILLAVGLVALAKEKRET